MTNDTAAPDQPTARAPDRAPALDRVAFSVREVAKAHGLSEQTVYREVAEGRLSAKKIRGRVVITRAALADWLSA